MAQRALKRKKPVSDIDDAVARLQAVVVDRAVLGRRCGDRVLASTSDRVLQKVAAVQAAAASVFGDAALDAATHSLYTSPTSHYRQRCRFLVLVDPDDASAPVRIADFYRDKARPYGKDTLPTYPSKAICAVLRRLLGALEGEAPRSVLGDAERATLRDGVRGAMLLSASATGETLLVLTYDSAIDEATWDGAAAQLRAHLGEDAPAATVAPARVVRGELDADAMLPLAVSVLGRSKGVLRVVGRTYVEEEFRLPAVAGTSAATALPAVALAYQQIEGSFTNPNGIVAMHTLSWLRESVVAIATLPYLEGGAATDLLELYCGGGNHTVALARCFRRVVGIEIDRKLCEVAAVNLALNGCTNAGVVRTPSDRFCKAMLRSDGRYLLRTMEKQGLALRSSTSTAVTDAAASADATDAAPAADAYAFETVLVDPPRAGLDATTRELVARYRCILYISCSPLDSLKRDLGELSATHTIARLAYFDHWPLHDFHFEAAVLLVRRES